LLVLTRYVDEQINAGDITITVLEIRGLGGRPYVKLGISAPQEVQIVRPDAKIKTRRKGRSKNGRRATR